MSSSKSCGLRDTLKLGLDGLEKARFTSSQGQQIDLGPQLILEQELEPHETAEVRRDGEIDQEVPVAAWLGLAAGARAKDPRLPDAVPAHGVSDPFHTGERRTYRGCWIVAWHNRGAILWGQSRVALI